MLFDGSTLLAKDAFVYGGAITLELETYLTDRIVLLANIRERALWGSSLDLFTTQFGLGIIHRRLRGRGSRQPCE